MCIPVVSTTYLNTDINIKSFLPEIENISPYLETSVEANNNNYNECDNRNVSHLSSSSSDTQNISMSSSEGAWDNLSDNSESRIRDNDPDVTLNDIKVKNVDKLVIAHININFLERKFEPFLLKIKWTFYLYQKLN